jgi:single-strand DNA-binding protein
MYQKIIIIGHAGGDPEMKYTSGGEAVTSFSVATKRVWTDSNGQRQERTIWFRVAAWRRLAEICNQYVRKGQLVMIEGELQEPRTYQSRDGTWRASLDIQAREMKLLGGRSEGGAPAGTGGSAPGTGPSEEPGGFGEEEIPF